MRIIFVVLLIAVFAGNVTAQDSIRIAMRNPENLDPVQLSRFDLDSRDLVENLFVGLTRFNSRTGQIDPWLAESWQVSDNGLTWTFQLRNDIQWVALKEGKPEAIRPVTAADVVFAIQRACDPNRPSPVAANIYLIKGCRAFASPNSLEQLDPNQVIAVRAVDETTVEFDLVFPASFFLTMTSLPEFRPLPAEFVDDSTGLWFRPDNIITSGAWLITDWQPGVLMKLDRNPFWPDEFAGTVETVEVRFDVGIDAIASELVSGSLDFARIDPVLVSTIQTQKPELLHSRDGLSLTLLGFSYNMVNAEGALVVSPLDNPLVRRALALALDRDTLAQNVFGFSTRGTTHFTPRSAMAGPSSPGAGFDPAAAVQALTTAGYPNCAGFGQLPIAVTDQEVVLAQNIVAQWQANLGCPQEVFPITPITRRDVLNTAHNTVDVVEGGIRYPLWIISWSADYPDAQAWIADALHCEYGYLRAGRVCDRLDEFMNQAGTTLDNTVRFSAYNQIENEFFGSQGSFPVIPLVFEQHWTAQNPDLVGISSYGQLQFDRWSFEG